MPRRRTPPCATLAAALLAAAAATLLAPRPATAQAGDARGTVDVTAPPRPRAATDEPAAAPLRPPALRVATYELLAGMGASAVVVPATLALSTWVGSLSSDLVLAGVPALLLFALVPPLVITGVEAFVGNRAAPGSARYRPAVWVALVAHVGLMVGGVAAGVWSGNARSVALFTLVESLVLPAAITTTLHLSAPADAPPPAPRAAAALPPPRPLADGQGAAGAIAVPIFAGAF